MGLVGDLVNKGKEAVTQTTRVARGGAERAESLVRKGIKAPSGPLQKITSGARRLSEEGRSAADEAVRFHARNLNRAGDAIVDLSPRAAEALDTIVKRPLQDARLVGESVRKLPGYDQATDVASFLPRQTLGRVAQAARENPSVLTAVTNPVALAVAQIPVVGQFQQQSNSAFADFVADTLETPQNLAGDPAGVLEGVVLAANPLGQPHGTLGYVEGVQEDIHQMGVVGGLTRFGLDVLSTVAPIDLPKGVDALDDVTSNSEVARGSAEQALDDDPPAQITDPRLPFRTTWGFIRSIF